MGGTDEASRRMGNPWLRAIPSRLIGLVLGPDADITGTPPEASRFNVNAFRRGRGRKSGVALESSPWPRLH